VRFEAPFEAFGARAGMAPAGTAIAEARRMNAAASTSSPPSLSRPPHYQMLGGDAGVMRLVEAFYRHMDTRPDARAIRAMHEPDLSSTRAVLVLYLREWLGGPKDYSAQRGHPRLRMRHAGFAIGEAERDAWLTCMRAALIEVGADAALQAELMTAFFKTADWMRNTVTLTGAAAPSVPVSVTTKDSP
jgi:hemoglobin